jgi:hypothetical protein
MNKLAVMFAAACVLSLGVNAHMAGEKVAKLPTVNGGTDAQKEAVKGAKEFCS